MFMVQQFYTCSLIAIFLGMTQKYQFKKMGSKWKFLFTFWAKMRIYHEIIEQLGNI